MKEMYTSLYQLFEARASEFADAGLPPVRTIDRWRNQTTNWERFEIYPLPAIFFAWRISWERRGGTKVGTGSLDVHVVLEEPWETSNLYTGYEEAIETALYHEKIDAIMDGHVAGGNFGRLELADEAPVDTGNMSYTILTYNFTVNKTTGTGTKTEQPVTPNIGGRLVKRLGDQ